LQCVAVRRSASLFPGCGCKTQKGMRHGGRDVSSFRKRTATHCNTLPHTATHCNALQHTASLRYILALSICVHAHVHKCSRKRRFFSFVCVCVCAYLCVGLCVCLCLCVYVSVCLCLSVGGEWGLWGRGEECGGVKKQQRLQNDSHATPRVSHDSLW